MLGNLPASELVVVLISIIFSMSLHEAVHGYVAHWLGDDTAQLQGRLTLNPLKHINLVTTILLPMVLILVGLPPFFAAQPVPLNPYRLKYDDFGLALVGIAGPLTNLTLAAIGGIALRFWTVGANQTVVNDIALFTLVNVGFFTFNMIPFPPLDGSRVLYAFAPEPLQQIMRQIESIGFLAILIFFFLIFSLISGPVINLESGLFHLLTGFTLAS